MGHRRGAPKLGPTPLSAFTGAAQAAGWRRALLDDLLGACRATLSRFDKSRAQALPAHRMQLLAGLLDAVADLSQSLRLRGKQGEDDLKR